MENNFYRILMERGFIEQATDPEEMENCLTERP